MSLALSYYLSGGGFSDVDSAPSYQQDAIQGYFNSGVTLPDASVWNRTGRGFPDVSAIGMNGYIIQSGYAELVSGTSMSTPIVAAIIALVQADYYTVTNSTLGFLNPLLYKGQAAGAGLLKDITVGDNCRTAKCATQDGFSTAKGWDPVRPTTPLPDARARHLISHLLNHQCTDLCYVCFCLLCVAVLQVTGLGSPVYPAMKAYVTKLGEKVVARRAAAAAARGAQ